MIAAKAFDIIIGIDIHIIQPPGPVPPLPIPHPFIGFVFDPMEFLPMVGATVWINGMPKGTAGGNGKNMPPHIPIGGTFVKPIGNECEVFMGSATVLADGDPLSRLGMPVLSCSCVGMPAPPHGEKEPEAGMFLPTSNLIAIPAGQIVMVGGPPTINMMAMTMKLGMGLLSKLKGSKFMKKLSDKLHGLAEKIMARLKIPHGIRDLVHKAICFVTGHPVDVVSGKVFTDRIDFEMPGPVPLVWERTWYSTSQYEGPLGYGWHHSYDMALYVDEKEKFAVLRMPDGRGIAFPTLMEGDEYTDRKEKFTLLKDEKGYAVRDKSLLTYRFKAPSPSEPGLFFLTSITNNGGFSLNFKYDIRGRLHFIVDSANRKYKVTNDDKGRITSIVTENYDGAGENLSLVEYKYDEKGNLSATIDALGHSQTFAYQKHLLTKETDRNGLSFYFEYDGSDYNARCIHTWGDGGIYDHKLKYLDGCTIVENSLGYKTSYFHRAGLVYKTVDALGGETLTEFNEYNELLSETDAEGFTTLYSYDENGNRTGIINPDGGKVSIQFKDEVPVMATDASGGAWMWNYNKAKQLVQQLNPAGTVTRYKYDNGLLQGITDSKGNITVLNYDEQYNIAEAILPDQTKASWAFDRLGRNIEFTDANGNTQKKKFDPLGRIIEMEEPDANLRVLKYDGEGNVVFAKDKLHEVKFTYTGMNRLSRRMESDTQIQFVYDREGNLTGINNEKGSRYAFKLDALGNIMEEKGFDGITRQYKRDRAGKTKSLVRPGGAIIQYEYDDAGRVVAVKQDDGFAEFYSYSPAGDLIEASNEFTTITFKRDELGRIIKEGQDGHEINSTYDDMGNRVKVTSSLGADISFERNVMGDISKIAAGTGKEQWTANIKHDALGFEIERLLPGGIQSRWKRDKLGRPIHHQVTNGDKLYRSRQYLWDFDDRLKQITDLTQGTTQFGQDAFGNLTWAKYNDGYVEYRTADETGNIYKTKEKTDRKYGAAGQLLQSNEHKYEYDAEGNLVKKTSNNGEIWKYDWLSNGMLKQVIRPDGKPVSFTYDPLGRRISKTYNGKTTSWVWDGNVPLHEWVEEEGKNHLAVDAKGDVQPTKEKSEAITWVFEGETFIPVAKIYKGEQFSIVADHLGTPTEMYNSAGEKIWEIGLSIYGKMRTVEGTKSDCPFRYPGQYEDEETGLYYNRFRYYSPDEGFYISQDPIGLNGGLPLYAYVINTNEWLDVLGLSGCKNPKPGRPTPENTGGLFHPGKGSGHYKAHAEFGGKKGWIDKHGNLWEPTGEGPLAHGGPHWDVHKSGGMDYGNVYPGGKTRGTWKNFPKP